MTSRKFNIPHVTERSLVILIFFFTFVPPGTSLVRVVAVDKDSGDNGRVSYVITAGNEEGRFSVGFESGIVSLEKPIVKATDLEITANDHGSPPRKAVLKLHLTPSTMQASGPPRLLLPNPAVRIFENLQVGAAVLNVAGPAVADQGKRQKDSLSEQLFQPESTIHVESLSFEAQKFYVISGKTYFPRVSRPKFKFHY